jgi:hypothetical protein
MITRLITAAGFSLLYMSMYPVLTGGFVIYRYPYWTPPVAASYVLGGVLLQAWFCFGSRRRAGRPHALWRQIVTGLVYGAVGVFPGGIYQS